MGKLDLDYFESILVYNALTDSSYLSTIADVVQPEFFKSKDIASVFTIIKEFNERRNQLPTTTEIKQYLVTEEQKSSFKRLVTSFSEIDKNLNKDELIENTEQFLKEKAVFHTMLKAAEDISAGNVDTSVILDKFEKSCSISLVTDLGLGVKSNIDDIIADLNTVEDKIPSTWEWLDDSLDGGFLQAGKSLYVFAGETNIGKSIFLGNVASNIAKQGKNVLLITLEMSELLYARRICTNISKIPMKEMAVNGSSLRAAITESPGNIYIKEFPPSTITPNTIKAFTSKFKDKGIKLDAIVIDYLNLIHSPIGNNSYERIKNVTEQVRALSYVFNCPIISATQLNRCLDINTLVDHYDGTKRVIGNVQVGDKIRGEDGFVEVKHVYPKEVQKCYKIKTKSGKEIVCSAKHLFPTKDGRFKSLENGLGVGDMLFVRE